MFRPIANGRDRKFNRLKLEKKDRDSVRRER